MSGCYSTEDATVEKYVRTPILMELSMDETEND